MLVPNAVDYEAHGGKAKTLRALQAAGVRVPEFLCSPSDLEDAVARLGTPLVVRSSASAEDGREYSFAGQFKSFLNLRNAAEVKTAITECEASLRAPGVLEYCRHHRIDPETLRMGVIVQRMIQPELAGVAFTVNPATGAEEVVIEACEGLADDLLLGRRTPLSPNHYLVRKYTPEIAAVAYRIQRHFGTPQDIEFAIEQGVLYVLQARPITQINFAPEIGAWTNADFRDGGVSSTVCTPLMWSLYDYIWEAALKGFLREIRLLDGDFQAGRMFFGRPYWNLGAVKACLARLPGFEERKFDEDLSVNIAYDGKGLSTPVTLGGVLRALPTVFAVQSVWKRQERLDREFLTNGFERLTRKVEGEEDGKESTFRGLIEQVYRVTETHYFRTIFCTSLAKLDFTDSFPEADYPALVAGLPRLRHFEPTHVLSEMRRQGKLDLESFLGRFRHHSRRELDIRAPRWDEDPDWVRTLYEQSAEASAFDPQPDYERARRSALEQIPWYRRRSFNRKLDRLRAFLWLREEMRDLSTRVYYLIRRQVLALGRRRGLGDDIFFMTFREILTDDRSQVERAREIFESYRHFQAPNEIGGGWLGPQAYPSGALRGLVASRGKARGVARVVRSVEEAARVEPGTILVCPFTDPGWTPVLSRVAGVVTETGGLLSHAAIICREYGIPALLSVPNATSRIPDGSTVVLETEQGSVEVLDSARLNPSKEATESRL